MTGDLVKMARLAQRDERMSTGALYGDLADRIEELEAKLDKAVDFCRRLERLAMQSEDWFVFDKCQEILDQLLDKTDARTD